MNSKKINSIKYINGTWENRETSMITEQAVTLAINSETWLTFMCTPVDLDALAVGFLYNQNIIQTQDEIAGIRVCPGQDNINLWLNNPVNKPASWIRTSGCSGGETSVENVQVTSRTWVPQNGVALSPEGILSLINQLVESQDLYQKAGEVHTPALSDGKKIVLVGEDIGRYNTLDKLAGHCLLEQVGLKKRIIITTGRISSEMIQKAPDGSEPPW